MTKLLMSMTLFVCLSSVINAQSIPVAGPISNRVFEVVVYPDEVYFGDPIYIGIRIKNISKQVVAYGISGYSRISFLFSLLSESISAPYHLLHEDMAEMESHQYILLPPYLFQPGESVLVLVAYQELPALEDMDLPFWVEAKKLLESGENVVASIGMEPSGLASTKGVAGREPNYDYVSSPLLIKPRPSSEMELFQSWLEGTPERLRPVPFHQMVVEGRYYDAIFDLNGEFDAIPLTPRPGFISRERYLKINRNDRTCMASNECFINVQGKDYFPYYFLRHGNRKPGDPVCPEIWQGWKELEDSLSPSTMRDEIRLTRICIQYCDTKDAKVLDELREWFADMNELQRWSMINSILGKAKLSYMDDPVISSFRDLYLAVREYDVISAKSGDEVEDLKKLGLLE